MKALQDIRSLQLDTVEGYHELLELLQIGNQEIPDKIEWRDHEIFIGSIEKQNMFGEQKSQTIIHHIGAQKKDLPQIMNGFLEFLSNIILFANTKADEFEGNPELQRNWEAFDVVAITGMMSLAFTLIHPLPDGNGRIHRLLINYILQLTDYCKDMEILPISPVVLDDNQKTHRKDKILEAYSRALLHRTHYEYNEDTGIRILNKTGLYYQALDCTMMADYTHHLIETARTMLHRQVAFIAAYDKIVTALEFEEGSREKKGIRVLLTKSFTSLDGNTNKAYSSNTKKDMLRKYIWTLEQLDIAADMSVKEWEACRSCIELVSMGFPSTKFLDGPGVNTKELPLAPGTIR